MKSLKIFFLTALVAVAGMFTACTEDHDWSAGEQAQGAQVYFDANAATTITAEAETASFDVVVMRGNTDEAVTVPIKAVISAAKVDEEAEPIDYAALFTVPSSVSFGAGKASAKITIGVDRANLEDGQTYSIALSLNDASVVTPYGYSQQTWTLVVPEPWVLLGTGYWTDDIVSCMFSIKTPTYPVEVYENLNNPGYIFLKNLYTYAYVDALINNWGMTDEDIEYLKSTWTEDIYVAINIEDPTKVFIPYQEVGNVIGNGPTQIVSASDVFGTLENGIISFPAKSIGWADEYNGGPYPSNQNGLTKLYMPGTPLTDYSLDLAYGGFRVADDDNTIYPIARAAYGEDVAEIQYAFVEGDITKDVDALTAALNGIEDGSVISNKVAVTIAGEDEEGEPILEMNLESTVASAAGVYTVIAVPYSAEGEAQYDDLAYTSFYVQGVGEAEVADVDFAVYAMSVEDLETTTEREGLAADFASLGYDSTNSIGVIFEGTEIKSIKPTVIPTAEVGEYLAYYGTIEAYIEELDAYYEENGYDLDYDLSYIEADGWDYTLFINKAPETTYTVFALVENIYGKQTLFHSTHTTDAADAAANVGGAKLRPIELDGAKFYRNFTSVNPISYTKVNLK